MNTNAVKCSCEDYDFYSIPIPLKTVLNRNKKQYISSQLEKLHPCFSDDCSFDTHLHFKKTGLKADVVVMQKLKLAEYKSKNKRLYIEEQKHLQVFADKRKIMMLTAAGLLAIAIIFAMVSRYFFTAYSKSYESDNNDKTVQQIEPLQDIPFKNFYIPDFLKRLTELKGSVQNLNWNYDGFTEQFSVSISGIYPEQLEDFSQNLKVSSVVFDSFIPVMTVNFSEHNMQPPADSFIDYNLFKNDFRKLIIKNKIELMEETVKPYGVHFTVLENQQQEFVTLLDFLQNSNYSLSKLNINTSGQSVNVELAFSETEFSGQNEIFQTLINNLKLFKEWKNPETPEQKLQNQKSINEITTLTKVGQIILSDGSVTVFYKDETGKIIKR